MRADQDLRDPAVAEQGAKTGHDLPSAGSFERNSPTVRPWVRKGVRIGA
jgi:hypothetical protein